MQKLRQRFIDDYSLPIQILDDSYFDYFINLYEYNFKSKTKWDKLLNIVNINFNNNANLFLEKYYYYRNLIIESIENTGSYKDFINSDMNIYNINNSSFKNIKNNNVYIETNDNRRFISIDLTKANFQSLKYHDSNLVYNTNTYEEFIKYFIGIDNTMFVYMKNSKYLRQVIFGKLNVKRQITIQKYIMSMVYDKLINYKLDKYVYSFSTDELVLDVTGINGWDRGSIFFNIKNDCLIDGIDFHLTSYQLKKHKFKTHNDNNVTVYEKHIESEIDNYILKTNERKELMCCPSFYYAQIYKLLNNKEIEHEDLLFLHEKQVCKFLNPLKLY